MQRLRTQIPDFYQKSGILFGVLSSEIEVSRFRSEVSCFKLEFYPPSLLSHGSQGYCRKLGGRFSKNACFPSAPSSVM